MDQICFPSGGVASYVKYYKPGGRRDVAELDVLGKVLMPVRPQVE